MPTDVVMVRKMCDLSPEPTLYPCLNSPAAILFAENQGYVLAEHPVVQHEPEEPEKCGIPKGCGGRTSADPPADRE